MKGNKNSGLDQQQFRELLEEWWKYNKNPSPIRAARNLTLDQKGRAIFSQIIEENSKKNSRSDIEPDKENTRNTNSR